MKTIGMARKVDDLGRIVLPVEMRRQLGIREGDHLAIAVDGGSITLSKVEDSCCFCESQEGLSPFRGKQICAACYAELITQAPASPQASST